jgi:hypothetical protein
MAGVTGYRSLVDGLFNHYMGMERQILTDAQEAALEAAIAGEAAIKHAIDTTPSSLSPGKNNRNWTFHMNYSVDSKVIRNGNTITMRAGWLETQEGYFLIQEDGGTVHGTTVTPMRALMAGHAAMIDTLKGWGLKTT